MAPFGLLTPTLSPPERGGDPLEQPVTVLLLEMRLVLHRFKTCFPLPSGNAMGVRHYKGEDMGEVFNRIGMGKRRRALRNAMPNAEVILWSYLRRRQVLGKKFRRQVSIKKYVVDFFCFELRLAIEVDGPSHFTRDAFIKDQQRQKEIEREGVGFLRFTNADVYGNISGVLDVIYQAVTEISKISLDS